jgi:hypothetical protein
VEFRRPDILEADQRPRYGADGADGAAPTEEDLLAQLRRTEAALHQACEYGRTLWAQLDEARHYLLNDVAGGEDGQIAGLLDDQRNWWVWAELFGRVSSALAGARGDSGFGRSEATLVARAHGAEVGTPRY